MFKEGVEEPRERYIDALVLATEVPFEEFDNGVIWTTASGRKMSVFLENEKLAFSDPLLSDVLMLAALFIKGHKLTLRPHHQNNVLFFMAETRCHYR